jgi:glucose dehydrogenase
MHRLAPLLALLWCAATLGAQSITTAQLENAARDTSSWLSYGRDPFGQRFVRLTQITPANVARLRPAWVFATGGDNRGLQATPLVHQGVLYLAADQSRCGASSCSSVRWTRASSRSIATTGTSFGRRG